MIYVNRKNAKLLWWFCWTHFGIIVLLVRNQSVLATFTTNTINYNRINRNNEIAFIGATPSTRRIDIQSSSNTNNGLSIVLFHQTSLFLEYCKNNGIKLNAINGNNNDENIFTAAINHQEIHDETMLSATGTGATATGINNEVIVLQQSPHQRIRNRVVELAKSVKFSTTSTIQKKSKAASSLFMPQAIAAVIRDATRTAVEIALDDAMTRASLLSSTTTTTTSQHKQSKRSAAEQQSSILVSYNNNLLNEKKIDSLFDEAFLPMEQSLLEMEVSLQKARISLQQAKQEAKIAIQQIQTAAIDQATAGTVAGVVEVELQKVQQQMLLQLQSQTQQSNGVINGSSSSISGSSTIDNNQSGTTPSITTTTTTKLPITTSLDTLTYNDIDYSESEMASPFLDEDQCLIPGEPVVRVEKAPENSRRIFAGIDISASVDTVWDVLTNYSNLQNVVPNLVLNDVLEYYNYETSSNDNMNTVNGITTHNNNDIESTTTVNLSEEEQCKLMCDKMKGSKLRQVGGAKVAGIQFSARTTLEVREWPNGMPDYAHFNDEIYDGKNRGTRAKEYTKVPLERYRFPRPFAISTLPTKDISMQSIVNDDGEFRMYQGVWRMQPLVGCAPVGQKAMRLTYAVQISPRAYLPVGLIEGRIVRDLCANLVAIRNYVATL